MAVKVISEKPVKIYRTICDKCCFGLEYTPIDVKSAIRTDYGGGSTGWRYIVCPREECKRLVEVKGTY